MVTTSLFPGFFQDMETRLVERKVKCFLATAMNAQLPGCGKAGDEACIECSQKKQILLKDRKKVY